MPKLPDKVIEAEAKDGTEYRAKVEVNVDSEGKFSIAIPDDLTAIAKEIGSSGRNISFGASYNKERVYSRDLGSALRFLQDCAKSYIEAEEITDRVLVFTAKLDVSFWRLSDGTPIQDGGKAKTGKWWDSKINGHQFDSRNHPKQFAIGIGAAVFDRITTKRSTGNTVRWERVEKQDHLAYPQNWLEHLNDWHCAVDPKSEASKVIPYTEDAARFFHRVMESLCRMAMSVDEFLGDEQKLIAAIEKDVKLLK